MSDPRLDAIRAVMPPRGTPHHEMPAYMQRDQQAVNDAHESLDALAAELERVKAALRNRDHVIDLFQAAIRAHPRWCGYRKEAPGDSMLNDALRAAEALTVVEPCDHQPEWITDGVCQACFALAGGARAAQEDK
jgi:hypothetical protein